MAVCRRQALGWLVDRAVREGLARGGGRIPHPQEVGGGGVAVQKEKHLHCRRHSMENIFLKKTAAREIMKRGGTTIGVRGRPPSNARVSGFPNSPACGAAGMGWSSVLVAPRSQLHGPRHRKCYALFTGQKKKTANGTTSENNNRICLYVCVCVYWSWT